MHLCLLLTTLKHTYKENRCSFAQQNTRANLVPRPSCVAKCFFFVGFFCHTYLNLQVIINYIFFNSYLSARRPFKDAKSVLKDQVQLTWNFTIDNKLSLKSVVHYKIVLKLKKYILRNKSKKIIYSQKPI